MATIPRAEPRAPARAALSPPPGSRAATSTTAASSPLGAEPPAPGPAGPPTPSPPPVARGRAGVGASERISRDRRGGGGTRPEPDRRVRVVLAPADDRRSGRSVLFDGPARRQWACSAAMPGRRTGLCPRFIHCSRTIPAWRGRCGQPAICARGAPGGAGVRVRPPRPAARRRPARVGTRIDGARRADRLSTAGPRRRTPRPPGGLGVSARRPSPKRQRCLSRDEEEMNPSLSRIRIHPARCPHPGRFARRVPARPTTLGTTRTSA